MPMQQTTPSFDREMTLAANAFRAAGYPMDSLSILLDIDYAAEQPSVDGVLITGLLLEADVLKMVELYYQTVPEGTVYRRLVRKREHVLVTKALAFIGRWYPPLSLELAFSASSGATFYDWLTVRAPSPDPVGIAGRSYAEAHGGRQLPSRELAQHAKAFDSFLAGLTERILIDGRRVAADL